MRLDYFNKIPSATILVNVKSGEVEMNKYAKCLFGKTFYKIIQLEQYIIFGGTLAVVPDEENEIEGIYLNSNGVNKNIRLNFSPINEFEYFLVATEVSINYDQILNDRFISEFLVDLPQGIIINNLSTNKVTWVSPYLTKRLGYSRSEIVNMNWRSITFEEDSEKEDEIIKKYGSSSIYSHKKRVKTKGGKIVWLKETVKHYYLGNDVIKVQFVLDVSNEIENETELQRAKVMLEEAENLKKAIIDNIQHEIRTPLHAIIGFSSLLNDDALINADRKEYVSYIQNSGNEILNIVENAIELSRLEANQVRLDYSYCKVNTILKELHEQAKIGVEKIDKKIRIISTNKEKDNLSINIDCKWLKRVLNLIIDNALKYTDEGEIEIGYQTKSDAEIQFYVRDTGIGIDKEQLELIFKNFGKTENLNTDRNRGGGLGLAIVKKVTDLLKGNIHVESEHGKGSVFTLTFPIIKSTDNPIQPSNGTNNWSTKTIIIAEDTELNYRYLKELLVKTKISILWAKNGEEAVELYHKNEDKVDLILMDILMPEMDGIDATRMIRKMNTNIPVIAQTALSMDEDKLSCIEAGCNHVLVKPIISDDLIAAIRKFMN